MIIDIAFATTAYYLMADITYWPWTNRKSEHHIDSPKIIYMNSWHLLIKNLKAKVKDLSTEIDRFNFKDFFKTPPNFGPWFKRIIELSTKLYLWNWLKCPISLLEHHFAKKQLNILMIMGENFWKVAIWNAWCVTMNILIIFWKL